ncbi:MAG: Immunoglobulin subtype [Chthoniobacteraceae bacterium]|nr:Immunoglobulin subtype [Chthoniobacteraceae bacterium]
MTSSIRVLKQFLLVSGIAGLIALNAAQAAVVVTTANQIGDGVNTFNPTFTSINTAADLLYHLAPSASAGSFTLEISGGIPILNDGAFGPLTTGTVGSHPALATVGTGGGAGTSLTYTLPTAKVLQSFVVYGGWNDNGRDQQLFNVSYSLDGTSFLPLGSVDFNPTVAEKLQSATQVTFTDSTGSFAAGVPIKALTITYPNGVENGYAGVTEVAAYAVPEPNSIALAVVGGTGLLGMLRRRKA